MNFTQLKYFNTIAATENMSKAAELLHVSQPALSKNISKLEEEVGYSLFTRNGKNIKLSEAGSRFLECSSSAVELIESGIEELHLLDNENDSRIKIGIAGSFSRMGECVAKYSEFNPEAKFDINGNIGNEEVPDINNYDVLVYPDIPLYSKFDGAHIYTESYYLAVPKNHKLARRALITVSDLNNLDIVFIKHAKSIEQTRRILRALAIDINKSYFVNTRDLHKQIIANGLAVGFVPDGALEIYKDDSRIKLIKLSDNRFQRSVKIAFKRAKHLSEAAKSFKQFSMDFFETEEREEK